MSLVLLKGDCLSVMKDISDASVDLIICDLPYGCLNLKPNVKIRNGVVHAAMAGGMVGCPWDVKIDLKAFWVEAKRILRSKNSPVIHFCTTRFGCELINSNPSWYRYDLVWNKQRSASFLNAGQCPLRQHEMIYVFSEKGPYYNRIDVQGDFQKWRHNRGDVSTQYGVQRISSAGGDGTRCVTSVFFNGAPRRRGGHPTEKPELLYRKLIERYCPVGGTVLDPTCGSGNAAFTAFDMDRHAIGIEMDDGFFAKMVERVNGLGDLIEHVD
jgi:DNA modification methylase